MWRVVSFCSSFSTSLLSKDSSLIYLNFPRIVYIYRILKNYVCFSYLSLINDGTIHGNLNRRIYLVNKNIMYSICVWFKLTLFSKFIYKMSNVITKFFLSSFVSIKHFTICTYLKYSRTIHYINLIWKSHGKHIVRIFRKLRRRIRENYKAKTRPNRDGKKRKTAILIIGLVTLLGRNAAEHGKGEREAEGDVPVPWRHNRFKYR